jgi:hypothetical protein
MRSKEREKEKNPNTDTTPSPAKKREKRKEKCKREIKRFHSTGHPGRKQRERKKGLKVTYQHYDSHPPPPDFLPIVSRLPVRYPLVPQVSRHTAHFHPAEFTIKYNGI